MTSIAPDDTAWLIAAETALARRDRSWPGGLDGLLHADFTEIGRSGRIWSRAEIAAMLVTEPQSELDLPGATVTLLTPDVAQVLFETEWDGRPVRRSSMWVRESDGWRIRFHQGTVVDAVR